MVLKDQIVKHVMVNNMISVVSKLQNSVKVVPETISVESVVFTYLHHSVQ